MYAYPGTGYRRYARFAARRRRARVNGFWNRDAKIARGRGRVAPSVSASRRVARAELLQRFFAAQCSVQGVGVKQHWQPVCCCVARCRCCYYWQCHYCWHWTVTALLPAAPLLDSSAATRSAATVRAAAIPPRSTTTRIAVASARRTRLCGTVVQGLPMQRGARQRAAIVPTASALRSPTRSRVIRRSESSAGLKPVVRHCFLASVESVLALRSIQGGAGGE